MRKIINDINEETNEPVKTSQVDNVYRDGYVSIEQQFQNFKRAGINRTEWLAKAYPSEQTKKHEDALFESAEAIKKAESFTKGDELNILDGQLEAQKTIDSYNELQQQVVNSNQLQAEQKALQEAYEKGRADAIASGDSAVNN